MSPRKHLQGVFAAISLRLKVEGADLPVSADNDPKADKRKGEHVRTYKPTEPLSRYIKEA